MKTIFHLVFACFLLSQSVYAGPAENLKKLFEEDYAASLRENPLSATYAGIADYNDALPSVAPEDEDRRLQADATALQRLEAIDRNALSLADQTSYDIFRFIKLHAVALGKFRGWRIPFTNDSGFHTELSYVVKATPFRTAKDYQDYLARLKKLPRYLDQNVKNMKVGLAEGFTQPKSILAGVEATFAAQVTNKVEEHMLYSPFLNFPASIGGKDQLRLIKAAKQILNNDVMPAFVRAHQFFVNDYIPQARESLAASQLPEGEDYYRALVRYYTTKESATPEAIHALGLKEVARIRKEMNEVIKNSGFTGTFAEFLDFLRNDPQFYTKDPEQLLKEAAWIAKRIDGVMPKFFGKMPRQPYGIEPVPLEIAPNYTTGRYISAPLGSDRGGYYWVNTYALDKRPLYELPALTLHEAAPGHHHQIALSQELENVPEFRKRFYPHAFGEGWGLYSEKLGIEMGVYDTAYQNFGRLTYEMWRACRLVVDTGIHLKSWTREQAENCFIENSALSLHNIRTEVDRYISWPGQALAYKVGELTILELRHKAQAALGAKFNLRKFHDAVLSQGGVPLEVLAQQIDRYIAEEK